MLALAPGVEFIEDGHKYFFKGRQLSGVTGLISKKLGLKMPQEFLEEHQEEGIHVHKAARRWIETGNSGSVHPGVQWLTERMGAVTQDTRLYSEVLISDFKQYASSIDIVEETGNGKLNLYDIKKGVFKRDYCTWQLSIYKYLVGLQGKTVDNCTVICLRDKEFYKIFPKPAEQVEKLLYG